jgi:LysM repeat protein
MVMRSVSSVRDNNISNRSDAPSADTQGYKVQQGDTLSEIASRNGTTVDQLMKLNPQISNKNLIYAGDTLTIPASQSYTIQHSDTLSGIASQFGVSVDDLVRANSITNPDQIYPNDKLVIPNGSSSNSGQQAVDTQSLKGGAPEASAGATSSSGKKITESDWRRAAKALGVDVAAIKAVADVEAAGGGFLSNGEPKILFEAHQFSRFTGGRYDASHPDISSHKWNRRLYKGGAAEHTRLQKAAALNETAALKSASWGKFQIMGSNYKAAGYSNVESFAKAMRTSEGKQLDAFVNFIKSNQAMHRALKSHNWSTFARLYNGPGYAQNHYDTKIGQAYIKFRNH